MSPSQERLGQAEYKGGVKFCCSEFELGVELESVHRLASAVDEVIRELA